MIVRKISEGLVRLGLWRWVLRSYGVAVAVSFLMSGTQSINEERRDIARRGDVFHRIEENILANSAARFTLQDLQRTLEVPEPAARRILARLSEAGIVYEAQHGVWSRSWGHLKRG
jgi:Fic family protein